MATEQRQDVATSWRTAGTAADLLVAEESVAATATAREGGEKSNLLHEGFLKLGASFMIALVCFAQRVGTYLLGGKFPTSTSTNNMVLIDVAPSIFTNGPK